MFRAEATAGVVNTQAEAMHPIDCRRVMAESAAILLRPKLSVDATIAAYMVQGERVGTKRARGDELSTLLVINPKYPNPKEE